MFLSFLNLAPALATLAVLGVVFVLGEAKTGLSLSTPTALGIIVVTTSILAGLVFILNRHIKSMERDTRQARTATERLQALLAILPGGYCLFSPQGLLREATRASSVLGVDKWRISKTS